MTEILKTCLLNVTLTVFHLQTRQLNLNLNSLKPQEESVGMKTFSLHPVPLFLRISLTKIRIYVARIVLAFRTMRNES